MPWFAVEYAVPNEVTYHNPERPFGPDTRARNSYVALNLGLSWSFQPRRLRACPQKSRPPTEGVAWGTRHLGAR